MGLLSVRGSGAVDSVRRVLAPPGGQWAEAGVLVRAPWYPREAVLPRHPPGPWAPYSGTPVPPQRQSLSQALCRGGGVQWRVEMAYTASAKPAVALPAPTPRPSASLSVFPLSLSASVFSPLSFLPSLLRLLCLPA